MKDIAFLFPGQGSQTVGMGHDLYRDFSAARHALEEVNDALSENFSRLLFEGPADVLNQTENAQPALMAVSLAVVRVLEGELGSVVYPRFAAGHSLGEYSALAALGALDIAQTAKLLRQRGRAMQSAVPLGEGGMVAVLGLQWTQLEEITQEASKLATADNDTPKLCVPANDNAEGQVVISGHNEALNIAIRLATERGAKRAVILNVSAPFHSPLMLPAAKAMENELKTIRFKPLNAPIICNVTAEPIAEVARFRDLLVQQITAPVQWRRSMLRLANENVPILAELGSGKVLAGLAKRTIPQTKTLSISTPQDISNFVSQYHSLNNPPQLAVSPQPASNI